MVGNRRISEGMIFKIALPQPMLCGLFVVVVGIVHLRPPSEDFPEMRERDLIKNGL